MLLASPPAASPVAPAVAARQFRGVAASRLAPQVRPALCSHRAQRRPRAVALGALRPAAVRGRSLGGGC
jgi:hypothetical protein